MAIDLRSVPASVFGAESPADDSNPVDVQSAESDNYSANINPSSESEVVRVAEQAGTTVEYARENFEALNYQQTRTAQRDKYKDSPVTRDYFDNAKTESWLSDDYEQLNAIETFLRDQKQAWRKGSAQDDIAELGWAQITGGQTESYQKETAAARKQMEMGRTGDLGYFAGAPGSALTTIPMMLGMIPEAAVGGLGGAAIGSAVPGWGTAVGAGLGIRAGIGYASGKLEAGLAYDEFMQMPEMEHEVAAGAALLVGTVNGLLETVAIERIARTIPGSEKLLGNLSSKTLKTLLGHPRMRTAFGNFGAKVAGTALGEGTIEALQELVTVGGQILAGGMSENEYENPSLGEVAQRAGSAFYEGSQAGMIFAGPGATVGAYKDVKNIQIVENNKKAIEILNENAGEITSLQDHPKKLQEAIKRIKDLHDATDSVYVEPEALNKFFQLSGVDEQMIKAEMPGLYDQMQEAKQTGGNVAIPIDEYVTFIAPSKNASTLLDDVKFNPDDYTNNELKAEQAEIEEVRKLAEEKGAPTTTIFSDIQQKLVEAGQAPNVAAQQAVLWESMFESFGERLPITAQEFFDQFTIAIERDAGVQEGMNFLNQQEAVVLNLADKLNTSRESDLVKKGHALIASRFLETLDGDAAVVGSPGSSVQETYINNTLDPLIEPYINYMDSKNITLSEFMDEVMEELSENLGGRDKAELLIKTAISNMVPPGGHPPANFLNQGNNPEFFSALSAAAEVMKQEKGTPQQMVQSLLKQPGVKPGEVEWTGLEDYLNALGGKVTKQQIIDYLAANGVQVETVEIGKNDSAANVEAAGYKYETAAGFYRITDNKTGEEHQGFFEELPEEIQQLINPADNMNTQFESYTLLGGTNYREVLLHLPRVTEDVQGSIKSLEQRRDSFLRLASEAEPGSEPAIRHAENARAVEERIEEFKSIPRSTLKENFEEGHFGDTPNVLAHIRIIDRIGPNGERILFIEEIQSDWAQEGRKRGFGIPEVDTTGWKAIAPTGEYSREWEAISPWGQSFYVDSATNEQDAITQAAERSKPLGTDVPKGPFVTSTDAWVELAVKKIMRLAAEGGYDRVAWTTGQQQATRYDLDQAIAGVRWEENEDGSIRLEALSGDMDMEWNEVGDVEVQDLRNVVGTEVAEKILSAKDYQNEVAARAGDDRGIGGEIKSLPRDSDGSLPFTQGGDGMRDFYDNIVPKAFKKVAKKLGGGKIEAIDLSEKSESGWRVEERVSEEDTYYDIYEPDGTLADTADTRAEAEEAMRHFAAGDNIGFGNMPRPESMPGVQNSMEITPAMQDSAMLGQPLFQEDGDKKSEINRLQMTAERGSRGKGSRANISAAERDAIAESSKATGIPKSDIEKIVKDHKKAHPVSQGWAALEYVRTKIDNGKPVHTYKIIPYAFAADKNGRQLEPGTKPYDKRVSAAANALVEEVRKVLRRADSGDENASNIIEQASWYKAMRARLRREFGGLGDVFADLLGATSPNTPVRDNWFNAVDALRRATRGDFDELLPQWEAWADNLDQEEMSFRAWLTDEISKREEEGVSTAQGREQRLQKIDDDVAAKRKEYESQRLSESQKKLSEIRSEKGWKNLSRNDDKKKIRDEEKQYRKAAILKSDEYKERLSTVQKAREIPDKLLPTKESGAKYGFNGKNVVRTMVDLWRVVKNSDPDIKRGGTAPKALNFSGNLIGFRSRATIDVWAARMLQRLTGGRRIPSMAESSVSGEMLEDGSTTMKFGLGQDVFTTASKIIRGDSELSANETLENINDDDLQAVVWFIEKELWTINDWTNAAGEGGSFELEANLSGTSKQQRVKELRKIIDASPPRKEAATAKQDITSAVKSIEEHEKKYADEIDELTKLESGEITSYSGSKKREAELRKLVKPPRDAVKLLADVERASEKIQNFNAKKVAAKSELALLEREVDRFTGGLSLQKSIDNQGVDYVPTDADMSILSDAIRTAIYEMDDGNTVLASKAVSTEGRYGDIERSLDFEVVTREGYNASALWKEMLTQAQQAEQDSTFLSRVLRTDENYDPLKHRPGIEIYFQSSASKEKLEVMLAELAKEDVEYLTVIVDGRRLSEANAGVMPAAVGVRIQYLPEFEQRYGDTDFSGMDDAEIAETVEKKAFEMLALAERVTKNIEGISYAGQFWYDTEVAFSSEYQEKIDAISIGTPQEVVEATESGSRGWTGQSIREGIEGANRQLRETASGKSGGDILSGDAKQLNQPAGDSPRGYIQFNDLRDYFAITLTGKANLSTFLHESGHFFLEMMGVAADMEGADPSLTEDVAVLMDWLGADSVRGLTTEQHEQFARGFEAYLMEGKAPNSKVAAAFLRFKGWLTRVYKYISQLDVELTDEVRAVMDRMVGVEQGFTQLAPEYPPMFESAEVAGMSDDAYATYLDNYQAAMDEAQMMVEREVIADVTRQRTDEYKARKKELTALMAAEVDDEPVYRVRNFLTGKWGKDHPNFVHLPEYIFGYKLDSVAVKDMLGKIPPSLLSLVQKDSALGPDEIAPYFGYTSGVEMMNDLESTPSRTKAIQNRVDAALEVEFGDIILDGKIEEESIDAIHNNKMSDFIGKELDRIGQKTGSKTTATQKRAAKHIARERILAIPIVSLNRTKYLSAERKSGREATKAAKEGRWMEAQAHKVQQLVSHHMYKMAADAQKQAETNRKHLMKYTKAPRQKALAKAGAHYLDAINQILDGVELVPRTNRIRTRRENLKKFMDDEAAKGNDVSIPTELRDTANLKNYKEMTSEELQTLRDTVDGIASAAKFKNELRTKQGRRKMKSLVRDLVSLMQNNAGGAKNTLEAQDVNGRNLRQWIASSLVKPEFITKWIDGETAGLAHSVLFQPLVDAQHKSNDMLKKFADELKPLFEGLDRKRMRATVNIINPLNGVAFTREEAFALALNMGNRGNLKKLVDGYRFDEETLIKDIQIALNATEFETIQKIWDTIDTLYPEIEQVSMDAGMGRPPKVEASELYLADLGITLKGGYYPIVYNPKHSETLNYLQDTKVVDSIFNNNLFNTGVSGGFKEARVEIKKPPPIFLNLNVIPQHLGETIHFITHYEAVKQVDKVLKNAEFAAQFKQSFGADYYTAMKSWLTDIANKGEINTDTTFVTGMTRHMRIGLSMVAMGLNFGTALMQGFGVFTTMDEIGVSYTLKGMAKALNPATAKEVYADVIERSGEVRHIMKSMDREIADTVSTAFSRGVAGDVRSKLLEPVKNFAFMHIAYMQRIVNVGAYLGALEKGSDQGRTGKDLDNYAEAVVRMTQSGAGSKDLARVQGGNEWLKLMTPFYTYFSVLYNRYQDSARDVGITPMSWVKFSQRMMFLMFMPVYFETLLRGKEPDEDEEWLQWFAKQNLDYAFTTLPFIREGAKLFTSDYAPTPVAAMDIFKDTYNTSASVGKMITEGYDWGDLTMSQQRTVVETIGTLGHLPTKTPWRIYESMVDENVEYPVLQILMGTGKVD